MKKEDSRRNVWISDGHLGKSKKILLPILSRVRSILRSTSRVQTPASSSRMPSLARIEGRHLAPLLGNSIPSVHGTCQESEPANSSRSGSWVHECCSKGRYGCAGQEEGRSHGSRPSSRCLRRVKGIGRKSALPKR